MRIRRLLAAVVLAGSVVVALPHAASADPGKKSAEELAACLEKATSKYDKNHDASQLQNAVDDCRKAKSIVLPDGPELLWGSIAFLIVLAVLTKFAFPMLKKTLHERQEKIRGDLEGAESARTQAEQELAEHRAQLAGARAEGLQIVEASRADAERVRADLIARAESEAAEIRSRAHDDIRLATERAQSDLQAQVKEMSIQLAELVVGHSLDAATQRELIDNYISQVGSN